MLKFPRDLYSDVRVEDVAETTLVLEDGELKQCTESRRRGAFVRVYDGKRALDLCGAGALQGVAPQVAVHAQAGAYAHLAVFPAVNAGRTGTIQILFHF